MLWETTGKKEMIANVLLSQEPLIYREKQSRYLRSERKGTDAMDMMTGLIPHSLVLFRNIALPQTQIVASHLRRHSDIDWACLSSHRECHALCRKVPPQHDQKSVISASG